MYDELSEIGSRCPKWVILTKFVQCPVRNAEFSNYLNFEIFVIFTKLICPRILINFPPPKKVNALSEN